MEKLVIDLGNTRGKAAVFDDSHLVALHHFDTSAFHLPDKIIHFKGKGIIASVGEKVSELTGKFAGVDFIELDHTTILPISNRYRTPETLGKDRLAGVVAAQALFPGTHALVIDAGTALTFDFIDAERNYLGGSISPGIRLRFKALNAFTHRLPLVEQQEIDFLIGTDTRHSILSGVLNGIVAEVEGIIARYREEYQPLTIILTGGDLAFFEQNLKTDLFPDLNLVLKGLNIILDHSYKIRK